MNTRLFKICFTNICGLRANLNHVHAHILDQQPDIFALGETQVTDQNSSEFEISNYTLESAFFSHRGVALYIRNDVQYVRLPEFESSSKAEFSYVWIRFKVDSKEKYFCFIYRSPSLSSTCTLAELEILSNKVDEIYSSSPNAEIIFAGDFNVHNKDWLIFSRITDTVGEFVEQFACLNNLTQLVGQPTRVPRNHEEFKSLLDLFLTSDHEKYSIKVEAPFGLSDHCCVTASFEISPIASSEPIPKRKIWHYNRANWAGLNDYYSNIRWDWLLNGLTANQALALITTFLLLGMNTFIPSSEKK